MSLRAERDTLVVVSNCPQINNPCNGFDPSRAEMVIFAGPDAGAVAHANARNLAGPDAASTVGGNR